MTFSISNLKLALLSLSAVFILSKCQKETQLQPGEIIAQQIEGSWSQVSYLVGGSDQTSELFGRMMVFSPDVNNSQIGRYTHRFVTGGITHGDYVVSFDGKTLFINNKESEIDIEGQTMTLWSTIRDRRGRPIETVSTYIRI